MFSTENRVDILIFYILLSSASKLHMKNFPKKNVNFVVKVIRFFFSGEKKKNHFAKVCNPSGEAELPC